MSTPWMPTKTEMCTKTKDRMATTCRNSFRPIARPATPVACKDVLPSSPLLPSSPPPPQSPAAAMPTSAASRPSSPLPPSSPAPPQSTPAATMPSNPFHPSTPDTPVTPTRTRRMSAAVVAPSIPRHQIHPHQKPPNNSGKQPLLLTHPTSYLYRRCPACFGDLKHDPSQAVDIQVCCDRCFTQKRRLNTGGRDPCRTHPDTVFVPESTASKMAAHVESIRPAKPKPGKQQWMEEEPDAADENREKASTRFFEDTGLMGLLCCHDRVLFLVNMCSAGKKQYYMLALLEMLFQHLPSNI
ncbi:hypothetical protein K438DRAFT_1986349 [Mycena galopus ATCC 62051]|nr:hypothetical protein K438DRAFT_1986349 [Mycena galopus ATCC 62051]